MQRDTTPAGGGSASGSGAVEAREGWRFLMESIGDHWPMLGLSFAVALIWTAAIVAIPDLVGHAVDAGILADRSHEFYLLIAIIAVLGAIQSVMSGARRYTNGLASRRMEAELRHAFFTRLLRLEVAYHDQVNRGQLLSRVTSDLFQLQAFVSSSPYWIASAITVIAVGVVLVVINPLLGLVTLVGLPPVAWLSRHFSGQVRAELADLQVERGELAGVVEEAVGGIRAVKGFGAEALLEQRLGRQADRVRSKALAVVALRTRFIPFMSTVPLLELVVLNTLGGWMVLHHRLSLGTLVAFNAYVAVIAPPLQAIGGYVVLAQRAVVSSRRMRTVLSRLPLIDDPDDPVALPAGPGEIRFCNVAFAYRNARTTLFKDLDLTVRGGEVVALVGATGSGKTTLLALLARLYDPQVGTVTLDGIDLRQLELGAVRDSVAVVFEENFLFDDTVRANLVLGREVSEADIATALGLARAWDFVAALPDGLDTVVGERGLSLSGGQRQRLALARALLGDPRVLVLDDATSAIDAANERAIVAGLARARQGRTTIIVSHRPATIASADRVILIDGGRVAGSGTHRELAATNRRYAHVLGGLGRQESDPERTGWVA
jgi:ATP-binding cassette subfamily B protein